MEWNSKGTQEKQTKGTGKELKKEIETTPKRETRRTTRK